VLNLIGYNTRKLGEIFGEGYLQKGDLASARVELTEIADRCGDRCEEYDKLEKAIVIFMTGDDAGRSY
jgi:hypothetical protein